VAAGVVMPAARPAATPTVTAGGVEQRVAAKINELRRSASVPGLTLDPQLSQAAREHSVDMQRTGQADHTSTLPGRATPEERYQRVFGAAAASLAENVARVPRGATDEAVAAAAHAALNLTRDGRGRAVDRRMTLMGVGCALAADGTAWLTVMFVQPGGRPAVKTTPRPTPTPAPTPPAPTESPPPTAERLEELILIQIGAERGFGINRQPMDAQLRRAAREHSVEMSARGALGHESARPGRSGAVERYEWEFGTLPSDLHESLAMTPRAGEAKVVAAVMHTLRGGAPPRRDNYRLKDAELPEEYRRMLNYKLGFVGVGCANDGDGRYWVTVLYAGKPQDYLKYAGPLTPEASQQVQAFFDLEAPARASAANDGETLKEFKVQWGGQLIKRGDPLHIGFTVERNEMATTPNGWGGHVYVSAVTTGSSPRKGFYLNHNQTYRGQQGKMEASGRISGTGSVKVMTFASWMSYAENEVKFTWEALPTDQSRREYRLYTDNGKERVHFATLLRQGSRPAQAAVAVVPPTPQPPVKAEPSVRRPPAPEPPATSAADEQRADEIRWLKSIDEALATADRRRGEAREKLWGMRESIRQWEQRIRFLTEVLQSSAPAGLESFFDLDEIIRVALDTWDAATMGPLPTPGDRARVVINDQIGRLRQLVAKARQEQDQLIDDTLDTYFTGIVDELGIRGPQAKSEDVRRLAKESAAEVAALQGLARADLYLAAGQEDKFRRAAQACIREGRYAADARYLEATNFLEKGDLTQALAGFRRTMALTAPKDLDESKVATRSEADALISHGDALWRRARDLAGTLENATLQAIDAKASTEALQVRREIAGRMAKAGDDGLLGGMLAYLEMGPASALSAAVHREDALVNLAAKYEKEVAAQHCGLLLMESLHERGFPLAAIDELSNEKFLGVMRDYYGTAGAKLTPADGVRMRAAVKAALRNTDVNRLISGAKQPLRVDSGQDYFDHAPLAPTKMESALDTLNIANLACLAAPMATYRISGRLAGIRYAGVAGESYGAGATTLNAREAFLSASRLSRVPALLAETETGQAMVARAGQFLAQSTWLERRGLEVATYLATATAGEAAGGTIGVMLGSDGKTEARAGRLFAELLTMWTVGDAEALKKAAEALGVIPSQMAAVARQAEAGAKAAGELSRDGRRRVAALRGVLPPEPGGGIAAPARARALKTKAQIDAEVHAFIRDIVEKRATPESFRRLEMLELDYRAWQAAGEGLENETRAWLDYLEKNALDDGARQATAQKVAANASGAATASAGVGAAPPASRPPASVPAAPGLPSLRRGDRLSVDLDRLWIDGRLSAALAGYEQRFALLQHLKVAELHHAGAQFGQKIGMLRQIMREEKNIAARAKASLQTDYRAPISRTEVERLDLNPNVHLERMTKSSYSETYWVIENRNGEAVRVGVFKGSGKDFLSGPARGQDLEAEEIFANFARELTDRSPPAACTRARMTVRRTVHPDGSIARDKLDGVFVRVAPGADLDDFGLFGAVLYKKQIAEDRVLSALFFDHDRKLGNYLVVDADTFIPLDHGMAVFRNFGSELNASDDVVAAFMENSVSHWVRRTQPQGNYRFLDDQITIEDMRDAINRVKDLFENRPDEALGILRRSMNEADARTCLNVLSRRVRVLEPVLRKHFGSIKDLVPAAVMPPRVSRRGPNSCPITGYIVAGGADEVLALAA